jgi:hypothetical protein
MKDPESVIVGHSVRVDENRHSPAATFLEMDGPVKKKELRYMAAGYTFITIRSRNKVKFYLHPLKGHIM